jgi:hypothetical protein
MNSSDRARCRVRQWSTGAVLAAAAAVLGMATAGADTPDDVIGQTITELNQGNVVLDAASTADLSARQADALVEQMTLSAQTDPILLQLEALQNNLPAGDQTLLGNVDEQLVTAAQNVVSADQAFVVADQAGELSSNSFLPIDLATFEADLGLDGALLNADFESFFTLFDSGFATAGAASAAALATVTPAELLSQASTDYTDANQVLAAIPADPDFTSFTSEIITQQDFDLHDIAQLASSETALSSYDNGVLTELLNPIFTSVNQGWDQASEAAVNAGQALQTAVASGSETAIDTAIYGEIGPGFDAFGPALSSTLIDIGAHLLTGTDPISAGVDTASAIDPGIIGDLLPSIGF